MTMLGRIYAPRRLGAPLIFTLFFLGACGGGGGQCGDDTLGGQPRVLYGAEQSWIEVTRESNVSCLPAMGLSLAASSDDLLYVAFSDHEAGGAGRTWVKRGRVDGLGWETVGDTSEFSLGVSLALGTSGTPYLVSYKAANNDSSTQLVVRAFEGEKWVDVGMPIMGRTIAPKLAVAPAPNGTLYLAYMDGGYALHVKRFVPDWHSGNWSDVGSADGVGAVDQHGTFAFAVSADGSPAVAYVTADERLLVVKRFDGDAWSVLGDALPFTEEFAIAALGTELAVAFTESPNTNMLSVVRWAQGWIPVVGADPAAATYLPWPRAISSTSGLALAFAGDGNPLIAFGDDQLGGAAVVRRYDGASWIDEAAPFVTAAEAGSLALAVADKVFVAFALDPDRRFHGE